MAIVSRAKAILFPAFICGIACNVPYAGLRNKFILIFASQIIFMPLFLSAGMRSIINASEVLEIEMGVYLCGA